MAYSFYIDEIYNDFRISNGDLVLVQGADNVVQQIRITLKTELGEWFLNTNFGLPYYSSTKNINDNSTPGILGGNKSAAEIEAYLVAAVLQVPGVVTINRFDLVEVSAQRRVVVNMDVQVESFDFQGIGTQSEVNISLGVGNDG